MIVIKMHKLNSLNRIIFQFNKHFLNGVKKNTLLLENYCNQLFKLETLHFKFNQYSYILVE